MCSLCRLAVAKKHNFGQILTFWGLLYRPPLTDKGQIWCAIADPRYTLTCQISSGSVYSVALCWRKTPIFAVFLDFGVSVLQRLHGEIGRTISDVRKRDEQTDRQTDKQKNSTFLATPAAGEIRAPPNLAW